MNAEDKKILLNSKIAATEHQVFDREVELEALTAESALGSEDEGYQQRIEALKLDLEKTKARLKSYKDQLKSIG